MPEPSASASLTSPPVGAVEVGEVTVQLYGGDGVTDADAALGASFVRLAVEPSPQHAAAVGLASDGVRLGLGPTLLADLELAVAHDPVAWELELDSFRANTGPFPAPARVLTHVRGPATDPTRWPSSDLQVSVGDHPHCASPPVPAPEGLDGRRRVSPQPGEGSITSCLDWFTVDLFLDDDDAIVAVTLDIWEP